MGMSATNQNKFPCERKWSLHNGSSSSIQRRFWPARRGQVPEVRFVLDIGLQVRIITATVHVAPMTDDPMPDGSPSIDRQAARHPLGTTHRPLQCGLSGQGMQKRHYVGNLMV